MTTHNFMIGPIKEGLRKEVKPYAIPEDAFETLTNAYQYRGRVVRRSGYTLLGRLSPDGVTFPGNPVMGLRTRELFGIGQQQLIGFDTTTAYFFTGTVFNTLPSTMPVTWSGTDSQFFFTTNYAEAFWATNSKPGLHGRAIFNIDNGNPAQVTTTVPHGFTTGQFVTIINVSGYTPIANTTPILNGQVFQITVTGANTFTIPLNGALYNAYASGGIALNNIVSIAGQDGIRYYANVNNGVGNSWVNYNPPIDPNNALAAALLIFAYRGYLVFLNTWEGNEAGVFNFGNRARWTQIGTPYYSPPVPTVPALQTFDPKAARDDIFGRGGANDAPTNEVIVAADFIRDILVVYFERSTWRLRFVNNSQNPFVWERVNIEFGSDCTFSTIAFDKGLMAIGNRGIVISDGNDTIRFDEKIPEDIFKIRQVNQGLQRVYGIRTFRTRLNFWTFPSNTNPMGIYPDLVLVFNYDTKNWSYFDDTFTCFGYYYLASPGTTWNDMTDPWESYTDVSWDSGISESGYESVVAGNQQGFVFELEQDNSTNDPSLSISAFTGSTVTSTNHNLPDGTWITLSNISGITFADGVSLNARNFKTALIDANNFMLQEFQPIEAGNASGTSFLYTIANVPIIPGSIQINVGALQFIDRDSNGILYVANVASGSINYNTGAISLTFNPAIGSTPVSIRYVSLSNSQQITPISTTGVYAPGGLIAKISNFDIQSKIFNFFNDNKRSRLSKIDFYVNTTSYGQFTCNVFSDSSDVPVNTPLSDNPQSNVVLTSLNPYQFGNGEETIYRLFCDAIAQTVQLQFTMSDQQMAINAINSADLELVSLMISMRRGGRLV
jgi:hypothetical protein